MEAYNDGRPSRVDGGDPASSEMIQDLSNGVVAPSLAGLSRRNLIRWERGLLDLIASLTSESASDNELRAFVISHLAAVAALLPSERQGVA